ncbi:unnamed protein product, partial [Timema podura]|nr:unnamed protein product [Timema podura]
MLAMPKWSTRAMFLDAWAFLGNINSDVWGPENPIEGDEVRLHCGGVVSNFSNFTVLNTSTYLSYQSTILIQNITKRYNGAYVCVVTKLEGYEEMKEINVHVQ